MKNVIKPYKSEYDYSYTSGAYATIELIKTRPQQVKTVFIHSAFRDADTLRPLCKQHGIPVELDDRVFLRVNQKENSYVLGLFGKYAAELGNDRPHIVLVNPGDMGNLGTIIRTMAGFGYKDLAIISPGADAWNPKTVRASMGAIFHIGVQYFGSIDLYMAGFPAHALFPFMLDGGLELEAESVSRHLVPGLPFALVFGNEATGLPDSFAQLGRSVKIPQSPLVDSLNVSIAAGIGMYLFAERSQLQSSNLPRGNQAKPILSG